MDGTIEEVVAHARFLESKGVPGMDLLSYRYVGDARLLLTEVVKATNVPIVSAGSIDSYQADGGGLAGGCVGLHHRQRFV